MASTALVLGAGGITGVAWQLGVIIGLRAEGVDLTSADIVIGTSAGAISGALIAAGVDPADAAIMDAPLAPDDPPMRPDWVRGSEAFALLNSSSPDRAEIRRQIGALALKADVGSEEALLDSFRRRLPLTEWPDRLVVTAVEAHTGAPTIWTAASHVPVVPAVAASCAVPCLFPPIAVDGGRYMDGGVDSRTHADLAAGYDRVVILAPRMPLVLRDTLAAELATLSSDTLLLEPDAAAQQAIGGNVFAADRWAEVLEAAAVQGRTEAVRFNRPHRTDAASADRAAGRA
jgi:NTE family protein